MKTVTEIVTLSRGEILKLIEHSAERLIFLAEYEAAEGNDFRESTDRINVLAGLLSKMPK